MDTLRSAATFGEHARHCRRVDNLTAPSDFTVLSGFAGPGGWEEGARILGMHDQILGVELDPQAAAAARSGGHRRMTADIRSIEPADLTGVTGCILSSPCPPWSAAAGAKRAGDVDYQVVLDVVTHLGYVGCDCSWAEIERELDVVADPRTALAAQLIRFALLAPDIEWLAFEQVPAAEYLFDDIAAELIEEWQGVNVFTLDAQHFGLPVRRKRVFLVARKYLPLGNIENAATKSGARYVGNPAYQKAVAGPTMAQALGWEPGHMIRTRGNRKATGGNLFSADGPSWCLTEKARTWCREEDGLRLTAAEAGLLQGFRPDYPWTGSRTRQFHQLADVVCPPVAAAVLGYATGIDWRQPVADYLGQLYGVSATDREEVA